MRSVSALTKLFQALIVLPAKKLKLVTGSGVFPEGIWFFGNGTITV